MLKIAPVFIAAAVVCSVSTNVFGMPQQSLIAPDNSFSVFFDPGAATLSKEGREIVSVVATRFVATQRRHAGAHIFVNCETDDQDSASLSKNRIEAVRKQLVRDGIQGKFVTADESPSIHANPVRLLEALDRRVSIRIQENLVIGRVAG
jgi:outer membrane protein OmpA-like peptidoglycan-associated protein